jgi:nucleoporin p58/p45
MSLRYASAQQFPATLLSYTAWVQELHSSTSVIHSDFLFTQDLKAKTDQAVQDTIIATRIVDGFRNPQQNSAFLKDHANFPLE